MGALAASQRGENHQRLGPHTSAAGGAGGAGGRGRKPRRGGGLPGRRRAVDTVGSGRRRDGEDPRAPRRARRQRGAYHKSRARLVVSPRLGFSFRFVDVFFFRFSTDPEADPKLAHASPLDPIRNTSKAWARSSGKRSRSTRSLPARTPGAPARRARTSRRPGLAPWMTISERRARRKKRDANERGTRRGRARLFVAWRSSIARRSRAPLQTARSVARARSLRRSKKQLS